MTGGSGFGTAEFFAHPLTKEEIAELQAFEESNPEYWLLTHGHSPPPDAAAQSYWSRPPADISYSENFHFLVRDAASAQIIGQMDVATDLLARGVYHLGYFMTATRTHGTGLARLIYDAYETWAIGRGAKWLRLGVVAANARAEAFWRRIGYVEVKRRDEFVLGDRAHVLITMVKTAPGQSLNDYLDAVPRDRK